MEQFQRLDSQKGAGLLDFIFFESLNLITINFI